MARTPVPPRSLTAALAHQVPAPVRARGQRYFEERSVIDLQAGDDSVAARVIGAEAYQVSLRLDGARLFVTCSCPYLQDRVEACKHVWALMLTADRRGLFVTPPDLRLVVDRKGAAGDVAGRDGTAAPSDAVPVAQRQAPAPPADWQVFLSDVAPTALPSRQLPSGELLYVCDPVRSASTGGLCLHLLTRARKKNGQWGKLQPLSLSRQDIARWPHEADRPLLEAFVGAEGAYASGHQPWTVHSPLAAVPPVIVLRDALQRALGRALCDTGRFLVRWPADVPLTSGDVALPMVRLDDTPAAFDVYVTGDAEAGYRVEGRLTDGGVARPLDAAIVVAGATVMWAPTPEEPSARLAPFEAQGRQWLTALTAKGAVTVPPEHAGRLLEALATSGVVPRACPDELRVEVRDVPMRPVARIDHRPGGVRGYAYSHDALPVSCAFRYGDLEIDSESPAASVVDAAHRVAYRRDATAERTAMARLLAVGARRHVDWQGTTTLEVPAATLPAMVRVLLREGWHVEAQGAVYRRAGTSSLSVRSGVDWFELHGAVEFDGREVPLPALLAARRRGDPFVALGDGTFGLLPEEWLARAAPFAAMGEAHADHVRYTLSQAALLDAWLATQPAVPVDERFQRMRQALAGFSGIEPVPPPLGFHGTLRPYQSEALAWFAFLRRFGFGGCLADEMGLGKTVMVLAMLAGRRADATLAPRRPSLVVTPRSLVFNWLDEAARFTPDLRLLDLSGADRRDAYGALGDHDLVFVTYGTLRRDVERLKDIDFDYVILDESQAIKNAGTASAKATRLLRADHRLALSGTPVENHLGELWSLFEFLNPGLLGATSLRDAAGARTVDTETLPLLARGLRPFILRRTKAQVAADLPERTEQTLHCELDASQRRLYDELRDHYRQRLLAPAASGDLGRHKLQVLEALLRLRQAACHPALIDPERTTHAAAKFDLLLPRLTELVEDGRQVLVFSQFTSLLALLRTRLDAAGITYEYLDGRTRDRQARVERFQAGACPLFLISLKAGGVGLNLTAAEYVFLLDPWWNPAVEAQAIDRAHRIGQVRPVFAYRLIAKDTVEERIVELQQSKRELADAVIRADGSLLRKLKPEDLERLLS